MPPGLTLDRPVAIFARGPRIAAEGNMALGRNAKLAIGAAAMGVVGLTCTICVLIGSSVSEQGEELRRAVDEARARCTPPSEFRLREGGNELLVADWRCIGPDELAVEARARAEAAEAARRAEAERAHREAAQQLVQGGQWVAQMRADCSAYDAAANEIAKSAVHQRNQTYIEQHGIPRLRGTVDHLSTTSGGATAMLWIEVGGFKFRQDLARGDAVYDQAASLVEGGCVEFGADIDEANGVFERDEVCHHDYDVRFTFVRACPATN